MADNYRELVGILKYLLTSRFAPMPHFIRGLLGDGAGNVLVPGRSDYNYARFNRSSGEVFEVFNKEVSQPVDGWPILIGEFPWQPGLTQVVGTDWTAYSQSGWGDSVASVQSHAPTHEWPNFSPGSDYLSVYMRAISPLRGRSGGTGTLNFFANEYEYDFVGTNVQWPGTAPIALGVASPATGTMRYMGVYLNPATNTLGAVTGSTTTFLETGEPPRPNWPLNVFPVAYARLYGGQAYFVEQDIRDARRIFDTTLMFTGTSSGGSGGGWPFTHVLTVSSTNADADYTTLALAIAGASAGDVILIEDETISLTATVTVDKALVIESLGGTIITNSITNAPAFDVTADNVTFRNLTLRHTGAGSQSGVIASDNAGLALDNCLVEKVSGAATTAYALWMFGGSVTLKNGTRLTCTSGTDKYGLLQNTAASAITIEGGRIEGTTYDISGNQAGSTLNSNGAILANGLLSFSGTVNGEFLDGAGDVGFGGIPGAGYKVDINGAMAVQQIITARFVIADDTAVSVAANPIGNRFTFFIDGNGNQNFEGVDTFNAITTYHNTGFSVVAGGGTLAGTTGPDGTINLRDDNGVLYIENRTGGSLTIGVVKICSD